MIVGTPRLSYTLIVARLLAGVFVASPTSVAGECTVILRAMRLKIPPEQCGAWTEANPRWKQRGRTKHLSPAHTAA